MGAHAEHLSMISYAMVCCPMYYRAASTPAEHADAHAPSAALRHIRIGVSRGICHANAAALPNILPPASCGASSPNFEHSSLRLYLPGLLISMPVIAHAVIAVLCPRVCDHGGLLRSSASPWRCPICRRRAGIRVSVMPISCSQRLGGRRGRCCSSCSVRCGGGRCRRGPWT